MISAWFMQNREAISMSKWLNFCKLKLITNICKIADNYFNLKEKNNV